MFRNLILPASILAGAVIGAGIFSLPFVFQAAGLLTSLFYLVFFAICAISIYILFADLIVRTPGDYRFVGYSRLYLGQWGFWVALIIGLVQLLFALTIYLILAPSFSQLMIPGGYLYHLLGFWVLGSVLLLLNTKWIAWAESFMIGGIILVVLSVFAFGVGKFLSSGVDLLTFDLSKFIVVGPVLFALSGVVAVTEVISYFRESNTPLGFLKKSLVLGTVVPAAVYFLFVVGAIGLSSSVTEDVATGFIGKVSPSFLIILGTLGFFALITSYIVVGLNVRRVLSYDLKFTNWLSGASVILVPVVLYFSGFQNFLQLVSYIGGITVPLQSILIIFMWLKADKTRSAPPIMVNNWLKRSIPILLLVFFIVLIYVIIS